MNSAAKAARRALRSSSVAHRICSVTASSSSAPACASSFLDFSKQRFRYASRRHFWGGGKKSDTSSTALSIPISHYRGKAARGVSWDALPGGEKQAWAALGWNQNTWDNGGGDNVPMTEFLSWDELDTAQQGAAMYGLGFDKSSWDKAHADESTGHALTVSHTDDSDNAVGEVKMVAKAAGRHAPVLHAAAEAVELAQDVMADPVQIVDLETIVYLDDSGSMQGSGLLEGNRVLKDIEPHLFGLPTRLVLFGSTKETLAVRDEGLNTTLAGLRWQGSSGGTYMWKMIEEDVVRMYLPGPGHLRVYIITDGEDNMSPTGYSGMSGMDPMMKTLLSAGYDIEFHIILIGQEGLSSGSANRYRDLALSTGGSFVHFDGCGDPQRDLDVMLERTRQEGNLRANVRNDYSKRLSSGSATNFSWLPQLPPPKK